MDDDVLGLVLGKLDGVQQRHGYWMARCPAHEDGRASLSVRRGDVQPVILSCKANCESAAVLDAIGLTMADISTPRGEQPQEWTPCGPAIAIYDYTDEHGALLYQVCRTATKEFPQRRPDPAARSGWTWKLGGTRRVPYRLPQLIEAVQAGRTIYVVEGEKDVAAVQAAGGAATCNPGGTGNTRLWAASAFTAPFTGADVVIVADRDEKGRRHAAGVAAHLEHIAASVTVVEAAQGKDAADHLAAGHRLDQFRPATGYSRGSVRSVSAGTVSDTPDTSDSDTGDDGQLLAGVRDGAWLTAQQFPPLAYAVDGLVPEGLALVVGPPKAGKSWLGLALLLAVASGGIALGAIKATPPRRVLYLALEDGDRRMQDRCRSLLGPAEHIPPLFCYLTRVQPGTVLPVIDAWMRRHPDTAMIIIDTLGKVMPPALSGESAYQRDYRIGTALKARADARPGLAVLALHHDRKAAAEDFVDSVSGTHGLAGAADTVIVLCRKRRGADGLLKVTGRDVPEDEYALTITDGRTWQLDGGSLRAAAARAREREDSQALGETMAQVLAAVREHPEGVRATDLAHTFGRDVYQYLRRLTEAGRIDKPARGLYVMVSEPSGLSEPQVSGPTTSDTGGLLSETWPGGSAGEAANPS